jgi:carboxymethylenebutenolidase
MQEKTITIDTPDGAMPVFITHPEAQGVYPVVVFYMDALGIREELRDLARRVATVGYYVLLPNLFYRAGGPSFDPSRLPDYIDPAMQELNHATTLAMVAADTGALLDYVDGEEAAAQGPKGAIGFCMGGRHALAAAAHYPRQIKAAASIHGGFLVTDKADSPHLLIAKVQGELYFGFARDDPVAPTEHRQVIETQMQNHAIQGQVEMHHGSRHGFIFPERYCYDKQAAERVWERWFDMLRRHLPW